MHETVLDLRGGPLGSPHALGRFGLVEESSAKTVVLDPMQREGVDDSLSDTSERASQGETVNSLNNHGSNAIPAAAPYGAASIVSYGYPLYSPSSFIQIL